MEFKQQTLENGLTVIAEVNPATASMAAGFFVRTGARDETPAVAGVSHFLEHMMFKGTGRRTCFDINREFDELGAHYNAFTSEENTVYYAAVLPEFQDRVLDLLCDMLRPALRGEDFDVEKNVILEEIAMYQDVPRYRLFEKMMAEHFGSHPLGHSVLGTAESITNLTRDRMQDYFDSRYAPNNMTVVGVGNLQFDSFVETVRQLCAGWPRAAAPRTLSRAATRPGQKVFPEAKLARENIGMISPAPSGQDERRYAAQVAATILGDSTGSRLFYALVDKALVDEASMSYDPMDGEGAFLTMISTDPARAAQVANIAREEFARFMAQGPTDSEMIAARNKIASGATLKGELPMGRLTSVGFDWTYRKEYVPLAEQIRILFDVTPQQVLAVVREYDIAAASTLLLGPLESI